VRSLLQSFSTNLAQHDSLKSGARSPLIKVFEKTEQLFAGAMPICHDLSSACAITDRLLHSIKGIFAQNSQDLIIRVF